MMADVIDAEHIGQGVIDGVEIWIEAGARPIPRKYVITRKAVAGAPQYTLRIEEWRTDVPADAFAFNPPQDAHKVALGDLMDIDEVPRGTAGGK